MEPGGDRPEENDGPDAENPESWYFDLPSGAWERQEAKNRELRQRVLNNLDDAPAKVDPFARKREPDAKKGGLFGMGRKKDEADPQRETAGGTFRLQRGGTAAGFGDLSQALAQDTAEAEDWSTEPELPIPLRPRTTPEPVSPSLARGYDPEPEGAPTTRWDDAFGGDGDDSGGLSAMEAWAKHSTEKPAARTPFALRPVAPDPAEQAEPPETDDAWEAEASVARPVEAEPVAETGRTPFVLRPVPRHDEPADDRTEAPLPPAPAAPPSLGFVRRTQEEHEEADGAPKGERWNELFDTGEEVASGGLSAMAEWAKRKDDEPREIPEEFLKPFDWEIEGGDGDAASQWPVADAVVDEGTQENEPGGEWAAAAELANEAAADEVALADEPWAPLKRDDEPEAGDALDALAIDDPAAESETESAALTGAWEPVAQAADGEPRWGEEKTFAWEDEDAVRDGTPADDLDLFDDPFIARALGGEQRPDPRPADEKPRGLGRFFGRRKRAPEPAVEQVPAVTEADWLPVPEPIALNDEMADADDLRTVTPAFAELDEPRFGTVSEAPTDAVRDVVDMPARFGAAEPATQPADIFGFGGDSDARATGWGWERPVPAGEADPEPADTRESHDAAAEFSEALAALQALSSTSVDDAANVAEAWTPDAAADQAVVPAVDAVPATGEAPVALWAWQTETVDEPEAVAPAVDLVHSGDDPNDEAVAETPLWSWQAPIGDDGAMDSIDDNVTPGHIDDVTPSNTPWEATGDDANAAFVAEEPGPLSAVAETEWDPEPFAPPEADTPAEALLGQEQPKPDDADPAVGWWAVDDESDGDAAFEAVATAAVPEPAPAWFEADELDAPELDVDGDAPVVTTATPEPANEWFEADEVDAANGDVEGDAPVAAIATPEPANAWFEADEADEADAADWDIEGDAPVAAIATPEPANAWFEADEADAADWDSEGDAPVAATAAVPEPANAWFEADAVDAPDWDSEGDAPVAATAAVAEPTNAWFEADAAESDVDDDPWAAFRSTHDEDRAEPLVTPVVAEPAEVDRWAGVLDATEEPVTEVQADAGVHAPWAEAEPEADNEGDADDPWASIAAASGYGSVSPSGAAVYEEAEPASDIASSLDAQMAEAGTETDAWAEFGAARRTPIGDVPRTPVEDEGDVVLRAFEQHASTADDAVDEDWPEPEEHDEPGAFAALLGDDAEELVSEVDPMVETRAFQRLQGWAPQRPSRTPTDPVNAPWEAQDDDDAEFHDPTAPLPWRGHSGDLVPPPPWTTERDEAGGGGEGAAALVGHSKAKVWVRELVETGLLALLVFLAVRASFQNFKVDGQSMNPTLADGQFLIVNKLVYSEVNVDKLSRFVPFLNAGDEPERNVFHGPERGDIVVLVDPHKTDTDLIKRVIGLPGETVEIADGQVYINDHLLEEPYIKSPWHGNWAQVTLPPDMYFVMGDNRDNSLDSRSSQVGFIPKDLIIGKAMLSYWPTSRFGLAPNEGGDISQTDGPPRLTAQRLEDTVP
jgi:signal peptidase I